MYFKDVFLEKYFSNKTIKHIVRNEPFIFAPPKKHEEEFQKMFYDALNAYTGWKLQEEGYDEIRMAKTLLDILYFIATHPNQHVESADCVIDRIHAIITATTTRN